MRDIKEISNKQNLLLHWYKRPEFQKYNAIIADGSIRSGKTLFMSRGFIGWAMQYDNMVFGMAGKTLETLTKYVVEDLLAYFKKIGYTIIYNKSQHWFTMNNGSHTNKFNLYGASTTDSSSKVQGATLKGFYFDEVALMNEDFVSQATARSTTENDTIFWFNCNPASPMHFFKTGWIDQLEKMNAVRIHFTMYDNPILTKELIDKTANRYSGMFYDRYILGKWSAGDDLIYPEFNKNTMVVDEPDVYNFERYVVSIDYGTRAEHPTDYGLYGLWDGVWYCIDEYYYEGSSSTDLSDRKDVLDLYNDLMDFIGNRNVDIIIDPSATSMIDVLAKRGIPTYQADNRVLAGIQLVQLRLNQGKVKLTNKAKNGIREFGQYAWDKKLSDRGEDKPIKDHDHFLDQFRYFCMYALPEQDNGSGVKLFEGGL